MALKAAMLISPIIGTAHRTIGAAGPARSIGMTVDDLGMGSGRHQDQDKRKGPDRPRNSAALRTFSS
jgi:hypothetical protein